MSWFKHKAGEGDTGIHMDRLPKGAKLSLAIANKEGSTAPVYFLEGFYYAGDGEGIVEMAHLGDVAQPVPTPGYADGNPKSLQGAKKFSLRYLPLSASIAVNQAFEDGAQKYGAANWREKGVATTVYVDAALRHIMQYFDGGQRLAADSGVHNLGHAMACLAIIIDAEQEGQLIDDRPFSAKDTDALLKRPVK